MVSHDSQNKSELIIKAHGDRTTLHTAIMAILIILFFTLNSFFSSGMSNASLAWLLLLIGFTVICAALWYLYRNVEPFTVINKAKGEVVVYESSIKGKYIKKVYRLNLFDSIQSYTNTQVGGPSTLNHVELVTKDNNRGLIICTFSPGSVNKFWALNPYTENPKASELCTQVATFSSIKNSGYVGHKVFMSNQVGIENGTEFINRMFSFKRGDKSRPK